MVVHSACKHGKSGKFNSNGEGRYGYLDKLRGGVLISSGGGGVYLALESSIMSYYGEEVVGD